MSTNRLSRFFKDVNNHLNTVTKKLSRSYQNLTMGLNEVAHLGFFLFVLHDYLTNPKVERFDPEYSLSMVLSLYETFRKTLSQLSSGEKDKLLSFFSALLNTSRFVQMAPKNIFGVGSKGTSTMSLGLNLLEIINISINGINFLDSQEKKNLLKKISLLFDDPEQQAEVVLSDQNDDNKKSYHFKI